MSQLKLPEDTSYKFTLTLDLDEGQDFEGVMDNVEEDVREALPVFKRLGLWDFVWEVESEKTLILRVNFQEADNTIEIPF